MEIIYKSKALSDIKFWKKSGQINIQKKITNLIYDIEKHPKTGIGQPEQLKFELSGLWSRRIDKGNRSSHNAQLKTARPCYLPAFFSVFEMYFQYFL